MDKMRITRLEVIVLASLLFGVSDGLMCDRTVGMAGPRIQGNGKFEVMVQGNPEKYVPGAIYTVRIQANVEPGGIEKFSKFLLVAEPALGNAGQVSAGTLGLKDDTLARLSEFCPNAVKHASEVPKSDVQVLWVAPPVAVGCVLFRATVVKNSQQWYMDDEKLTKEFCPEDEAQEDDNWEPCSACDEAKYELTFEGIWSALTHPEQFPPNGWTTSFSDIIGASHGPQFRFWEYGKLASEGLRTVAEIGDTRILESELKDQSTNIRTIIKARGIRHTNFNGLKTFAVFRADKNHNFVSLVSKIDPSPDWFVGVSALNLCGKNGSWLVDKEINLYPVDAGTDSGSRYDSEDSAMHSRAEIQRLARSANPDSPFFDPEGKGLKPFAKLRIQQQRIYRRGSCDESFHQVTGVASDYGDDGFEDDSPDRERHECAMHPWSPWSPCAPTCGKGTRKRTRRFVDEGRAREFGCNRREVMERICYNAQSCKGSQGARIPVNDSRPRPSTYDQLNIYNQANNQSPYYREPRPTFRPTQGGIPESGRNQESLVDPLDDVCGTTEWRKWSICADPCGVGVRHQTRSFLHPLRAKQQKCFTHVKLMNREKCPRAVECRESETAQKVEEGCEVTEWGPWHPCSVTCGKGVKTRDRLYVIPHHDHRTCTKVMQETVPCDGVQAHCPPERTDYSNTPTRTRHSRPVDDTHSSYSYPSSGIRDSHQWQGYAPRYSSVTTPTPSYQHARPYHQPSDDGPSVDCKLSAWSPWSTCSVSCGRGWKYQSRYVEVFNENGGRPCSPLLERSRRCKGTNCRNNPQGLGGSMNQMTDDYYNYQE